MKRTTSTAHHRPIALTALVSLSMAGSCLALPGLALAEADTDAGVATSAATMEETDAKTVEAETKDTQKLEGAEEEEAENTEAEGAQILSFAGVRVDAPLAMEALGLDDANMITAALPEGGLSVAITDCADEDEAIPDDPKERQAFFADLADELAESMDATITSDDALELADGTPAYLFEIDEPAEEENSLSAYFAFVYVPTGDGAYACVQISCIGEDVAPYEEDIDAMLSSIALAEADEAAAAPAVELDQQVESMGLAFGLPANMEEAELEGAGDEIETRANADGSFTVRAVGNALPTVENPTQDDITADVEDLAAMMEGETEAGAVSWNDDDTTVFQFVTCYEFEDTEYVTTYGCAVLPDGTSTYVIGDCTADDYEQYAPVLDAIYASITLA